MKWLRDRFSLRDQGLEFVIVVMFPNKKTLVWSFDVQGYSPYNNYQFAFKTYLNTYRHNFSEMIFWQFMLYRYHHCFRNQEDTNLFLLFVKWLDVTILREENMQKIPAEIINLA